MLRFVMTLYLSTTAIFKYRSLKSFQLTLCKNSNWDKILAMLLILSQGCKGFETIILIFGFMFWFSTNLLFLLASSSTDEVWKRLLLYFKSERKKNQSSNWHLLGTSMVIHDFQNSFSMVQNWIIPRKFIFKCFFCRIEITGHTVILPDWTLKKWGLPNFAF